MNYIEILVNINGEWRILDLINIEGFALNFNLSDITDIGSRNSSYSKTITIPDNKHNRLIFEMISELTVDSLFNVNLKTPCIVKQNGVTVFDNANLQLSNIITNYETGENVFEIIIYNETDTLFSNIGEKLLIDLDFTYLDHIWNYENVTDSWTQSLGYVYPLIDNGNNWNSETIGAFNGINTVSNTGVYIENMRPALRTKEIFDRIIDDAGFKYKSNFLDSDYFSNIINPSIGVQLLQSDIVYDNQFYVEYDSNATYSLFANNTGTYRIPFSNEILDTNNNYFASPTYSYIRGTVSYAEAFQTRIQVNFLIAATVSGTLPNVGITNSTSFFDCDIYVKFRRDRNTGASSNVPIDGGVYSNNDSSFTPMTLICRNNWFPTSSPPITSVFNEFTFLRPGSTAETFQVGNQIWASFSCTIESDLLDNRSGATPSNKYQIVAQGEKIDVLLGFSYNTGGNFFTQVLFPLTGGILKINSESNFSNIISNIIFPDGIMNMRSSLHRKFKQKDFIKGLITMFNLYIEPDKLNNRTLLIEPRKDYFTTNSNNWSEKIDLSSIKLGFLSDFQSKKNILTYKEDSDYQNSRYLEITKDVYGQYDTIFDNDFITDEKKIESTFSPTPIISIGRGFPLSRITQDENGGVFDGNLRIMFFNYIDILADKDYWVLYETIVEGSNSYVQDKLPWGGHLDNPFQPQYDLNFDQVFTSSFEWLATNNTLANTYWKDYLDLINNPNPIFMTANFYLDEYDINKFDFRNPIYLDIRGQIALYIVNKIYDYNPIEKTTCKVELIKIN
jgi:hypothetical protein